VEVVAADEVDAVARLVLRPAVAVAAESKAFLQDVPQAAAPIRRISRTFRKAVP
jgi:hypothetical protein